MTSSDVMPNSPARSLTRSLLNRSSEGPSGQTPSFTSCISAALTSAFSSSTNFRNPLASAGINNPDRRRRFPSRHRT